MAYNPLSSAYEEDGVPVDGGYTVADLKAIARRTGVRGSATMVKNELLNVLNERLENGEFIPENKRV